MARGLGGGLALAATLLGGGAAEATPIVDGTVLNDLNPSYALDFDLDGSTDAVFSFVSPGEIAVAGQLLLIGGSPPFEEYQNTIAASSTGEAMAFGPGDTIFANIDFGAFPVNASTFTSAGGTFAGLSDATISAASGHWTATTDNWLVLHFFGEDVSGGAVGPMGAVQIVFELDGSAMFNLTDWVPGEIYTVPGDPGVPEPGTVAIVVLGGASAVVARRRSCRP